MTRVFRRLRQEQEGFTILEVVIAMSVLAMLSIGFATTSAGGLRLVGTSNERQTGVQVANESMETARATPYTGLALRSDTSFEGAGTPDTEVTASTYKGEQLVFDDEGAYAHRESTVLNGASYEIYRYVTWVPDGAEPEAYKRVTIVVQWDGGGTSTTPSTLTQSTIISKDGVQWVLEGSDGATTTTAAPTTTTVPATTTTIDPDVCEGDGTPPSGAMSILAGTGANTGYTNSSTVNLSLETADPCAPVTMSFSNDGSTWSASEPFNTSKVWTLQAGNGDRTAYARFTDGAGNSSVAAATVRVDATPPTTPGSFTARSYNNPRRVVLTWTQSTDNDTVIGYRIYVKPQNGSYQNQPTGVSHPCATSPCTWTHSGVRNKDVYTYYVVSYDAAGNESARTVEKTVTV